MILWFIKRMCPSVGHLLDCDKCFAEAMDKACAEMFRA